jgi:hypothetical protein
MNTRLVAKSNSLAEGLQRVRAFLVHEIGEAHQMAASDLARAFPGDCKPPSVPLPR